MDKNSIIGLALIAAILIGFSVFNSPSKEELAVVKRKNDSIAAVAKLAEKEKQQVQLRTEVLKTVADTLKDTLSNDTTSILAASVKDSLKEVNQKNIYGAFYQSVDGKDETITIENELMKVGISSKGGRIRSVELKKYTTFDKKPLFLVEPDSSKFGLSFISQNRIYNTDSLYFKAQSEGFTITGDTKKAFAMRLYAGDNKYIEYQYKLSGNNYMLDFNINIVGMQEVIAANSTGLDLNWSQKAMKHEKGHKGEQDASTIYYKHFDDEVDYLSEMKDEKESIPTKLKWVAFKQQFFTSVLVSKTGFEKPTDIETIGLPYSKKYVKSMSASLSLPYGHQASESIEMSMYFGPNHYKTLKQYDLALEKQIPLGWGIFGWVNRFCVIPVFNFLSGFNLNYGIIILILTVLIKIVLLPLTYKAYLSTAKMKVLKPEVDEINLKFGTDDPMKKQQTVMALYRKAGVNPLGGCLPMLLQMPILIAMFRFFPSSIELRQQPFLWATDLSTYDSIYNFGFEIPFYGDHVSLFTLLMTVSTIIYTRMNNQLTGDNPQMAQMKWIMYLMPIVFLGVFNNYAAGLSYYYFLANMLTFGQQWLIKRFVDEDAIHRKIQENKKKPESAKKSSFQQKLETMAKQQQQRALQNGKKK